VRPLYVARRVIEVPPPLELLLLLLMYLRLMPRMQSVHMYYRNSINALPLFSQRNRARSTMSRRSRAVADPAARFSQ
jgi:hypothetical protein